jgi:hypothetical protein
LKAGAAETTFLHDGLHSAGLSVTTRIGGIAISNRDARGAA